MCLTRILYGRLWAKTDAGRGRDVEVDVDVGGYLKQAASFPSSFFPFGSLAGFAGLKSTGERNRKRGMKFGKDFRNHLEETLPEWRDKFLAYKALKKLIKHLPQPPPLGVDLPDEPPRGAARPLAAALEAWFVGILNEELEKFNDFYVDKEEDFVIRLQVMRPATPFILLSADSSLFVMIARLQLSLF
ncbi:hypothetical protein GW17_00019448 [Ensete ventricosum]|nr:hypothetical protein GW17_00019448 [Ensete ventricosum]